MPITGAPRLVIRAVIPELYTTFKSASRALEWLSKRGFGYRKKDFFADWREVLGFDKRKEAFKYIPKKYAPYKDLMTETEYDIRSKYQYVSHIEYIEKKTGLYKEREISLPTDRLLSMEEAEMKMGEIIEESWDDYNVKTVVGMKITGVRVKK
jgi:hypothetical protein